LSVKKSALVSMAALAACAVLAAAPAPSFTPQKNLDAFMKEVLAKRDENWKKLQQYILDEKERMEVTGLGGMPIWGEKREYQWFIKDGYFVRSPITADGVKISDADRTKYEENFLKRQIARDKKEAEKAAKSAETPTEPESSPPTNMDALLKQARQPQFIDSAYFMEFKFDLGTYALVGKEKFGDHDVLRIEYYPTKLFNDDEEREKKKAEAAKKGEPQKDQKKSKGDQWEASINHLMNKNSLVTLWVEPGEKQIVRYKFDNMKMDFLPVSWLVRVEALKATMNMSEPFKNVWLPKDVEIEFSALLAIGPFDFRYRLDYLDYREAKTSGRVRGRGGEPR